MISAMCRSRGSKPRGAQLAYSAAMAPQRITTSAVRVRIREKGYTGDGGLEEEAEGYFDQIMAAFAQTRKETTETAGRAEGAEKSAEGWAHGHEDFPERAEDNAMYYADRARGAAADAAGSFAGAEASAEDIACNAAASAKDRKETAGLYSPGTESRRERTPVRTEVEKASEEQPQHSLRQLPRQQKGRQNCLHSRRKRAGTRPSRQKQLSCRPGKRSQKTEQLSDRWQITLNCSASRRSPM